MTKQYKGFSILVNAEQDDTTGDWNGRYRIMNDEGVVVYESFSDVAATEDEAVSDAEDAAYAWVDYQ